MERAIEITRDAGGKVAFTLSDSFCIERHRDSFNALIDSGRLDILFANEAEIVSLTGEADFDAAVAAAAERVPVLVVTRGEKGAVAVEGGEQVEVPAEPVERIVDTTGAGDLFAAGFLTGRAQGRLERREPAHGRDRRGRGHLPLRRAAGGGPEGAGRRRD